jgi:hypothetical protein
VIILDDDNGVESDVEIEEQSSINRDDNLIFKGLIGKLEINTEVIIVKPNLPIRTCKTSTTYPNLQDTHIITVH